ncbi:hypothetical protein EV360DRAFT_90683 [Lentinula raphanica]|nr:hypothetical protein EV360DRAFT_90683 [Lentinula raphanica]
MTSLSNSGAKGLDWDVNVAASGASANNTAPPSVGVTLYDAANNPRATDPLSLTSHSAVVENVHLQHAVMTDANVMSSRAMQHPRYHRHLNPSLRNAVPNHNPLQASKRVKTGDWTFTNHYPSTEEDSNQLQDGVITQGTNIHKRKSTADSGSHAPGAMSGANHAAAAPSQFSQFRFPTTNLHLIQNSTRTPRAEIRDGLEWRQNRGVISCTIPMSLYKPWVFDMFFVVVRPRCNPSSLKSTSTSKYYGRRVADAPTNDGAHA